MEPASDFVRQQLKNVFRFDQTKIVTITYKETKQSSNFASSN